MARTLPGTRPGGRKYRVARTVTNKLVNPAVRALIERGLFPPAWALLETTGRKSGKPRRTPVGNGKRGDVFWVVTEHGHHADYVKNIKKNPRVRVKIGRRWHSGTAHILEHDDPYARLRKLRRPVNDSMLLAIGTQALTIRIDLDDG